MHINIDKHAYLNSCIHRWDPRIKILSLFILLLAFSLLQHIVLIPGILLISLGLVWSSKVPMTSITKRLRYPVYMLFFLIILLAFSSGGRVLYSLKYLYIYETGIYLGILIAGKAVAQLMVCFVLLDTAPFTNTIKALYSLKVPDKLVKILFFTVKYVYTYLEQLRKMNIALKLRGYQPKFDLYSWKTSAGIIGSIVVRSFEQAEKVTCAMALRGYNGKNLAHHDFRITRYDYLKGAVILLLAVVFTLLDRSQL